MCIPNRSNESKLTHESLTELLHYNPEAGVFTWKVKRRGKARVGDIAGTLTSVGCIHITIDGTLYKAHRLAWFYVHREWPNIIDHINRNRTDNRIFNLRSVSYSENSKNQKIHSNNTSGHCGVHFHKQAGKWMVQIKHEGVQKNLGLFNNIEDAIRVRKAAELEYGYHPTHGNVAPIISFAVAV